MKKFNKYLGTTIGAAMLVASPQLLATNGYFTHGSGTKNKGMAGAGIAMPEEAMAISNNPASALLVGDRLDAGAALFNPKRSYTTGESANADAGATTTFTIGPQTLDSAREWFVIPHVAYTKTLDDDSAWGVAFYGRGGMNTRWEGGSATFDPDGPGPAPVMELPGTFGVGRAGVDLMQAFLDISYSRKLSESLIGGISLVTVAQMFEAEGLQAFTPYTQSYVDGIFATGMPGSAPNLSNMGLENSFGVGAQVGFHYMMSPSLMLAGTYQTEIDMSEFDEYSDLFANGGDFDIPANAKLGLTFKANSNLAVSFDIEQTWFSKVGSVGNAFSNLFTCPTANGFMTMTTDGCLGGDNGAGFGWDDMTTYKIGAQWEGSNGWTWRAGFSHGSQPIPDSEVLFNILAPAVIDNHITFGFTKETGTNREINFAFMHALNNSVSGVNPLDFDPASPMNPPQSIELEMDQIELELSYNWKF